MRGCRIRAPQKGYRFPILVSRNNPKCWNPYFEDFVSHDWQLADPRP